MGLTTTVAVFFHEIPHEIGDVAILLQSGYTWRQAVVAQIGTAIGALIGARPAEGQFHPNTGRDCAATDHADRGMAGMEQSGTLVATVGLWTDAGSAAIEWVIPFTGGGFIYVAAGTPAARPRATRVRRRRCLIGGSPLSFAPLRRSGHHSVAAGGPVAVAERLRGACHGLGRRQHDCHCRDRVGVALAMPVDARWHLPLQRNCTS